jgi:N-acetylglucosamine kinase-like BadF-type ATPase
MTHYLAIDGGGTKTRCLLAGENTILAKAMSGGCNLVRLGERQARESLHNAIRKACTTANVSPDRIGAVCVGAAGAGRPEIAARIRSILQELTPELPSHKIEVVGDSTIALEAAFESEPGVIAIAGTGSIVFGRAADGRTARAGGWGFAVSDEGSGHWIGRLAVSSVLSAGDQGLSTALHGMILQAWKLASIDELVQQANTTPPPDFPKLFPVVLHAADQGDAIASDLLSQAGTRLAALAAIVVRRLAADANGDVSPSAVLPIAMTGSVFRQSAVVRQVFRDRLQSGFPGVEVRPGLVEPVEGALARARRL